MPIRRPALTFAAILLLLIAVPMPAFAAAGPTHLEGTLELLHGENFESGEATFEYRLQTARENVRLKFDGDAPAGFVTGAKVRVHGKKDGPTLVALDGENAGEVLVSAPGWSGQRKIAVILVNFTNDRSTPFSRSFADAIVFGNANSVRAYFEEESYGAMRLTGRTFDWVTIPYSNTACDNRAWEPAARTALAERGEDLSTFTNFMLLFPQTSNCYWRGMGHLPGWTTWINGAPTLRTAVHELGHNFGVHHATALRCTKLGERVKLSKDCTATEYGDPFTTMGEAAARHGHNLSLLQMGYLPASAARTIVTSRHVRPAPRLCHERHAHPGPAARRRDVDVSRVPPTARHALRQLLLDGSGSDGRDRPAGRHVDGDHPDAAPRHAALDQHVR